MVLLYIYTSFTDFASHSLLVCYLLLLICLHTPGTHLAHLCVCMPLPLWICLHKLCTHLAHLRVFIILPLLHFCGFESDFPIHYHHSPCFILPLLHTGGFDSDFPIHNHHSPCFAASPICFQSSGYGCLFPISHLHLL